MAISTETQALLDLYNQKISLDTQQLSQISTVQTGYTINTGIGASDQIKIWGPTDVMENYNPPIKKLDNRIIEINNQINNLQQLVLDVGQEANSVGCGSTGVFDLIFFIGFSTETVVRDELNYRGYAFTAPNPFSPISGTLINSNSGIGTEDYITQPVLGEYFGPIGTDGECAGYAISIANLNSQIVSLQNQRNPLIEKVNFLKAGRSQYELQNYGLEQSKVQVNSAISASSSIVSFLQDPANAEWL
jgi:hypothetical protein